MKHETHAMNTLNVKDVDLNDIKFFVRRSRAQGAYARLKESIREVGLRQPIHVRDISDWPASKRRRSDGGLYKYELICGQGRLQAFRDLGLQKIPALVVDVPETEIVGRFLAENVMRKRLSWCEKAQLVKQDIERGLDVEQIKAKYFVTTGHVYKYLRILRQASPKLLSNAQLEKLSMNDAEDLITLGPKEQEIVVEVLKEENLGTDQIKSLVRKAKELRRKGEVSKGGLKASLRDLDDALKEVHNILKSKRLHWSLGPFHLRNLLQVPEFKNAMEREGVDYLEFLKTAAKGGQP